MHFTHPDTRVGLLGAMLLCSLQATITLAAPTAKPLHSCSVFVQRWSPSAYEAFDASYISNGALIYDQVSINNNAPNNPFPVGAELVPYPVGSNNLHITNVANPVNNNDPGKLSFKWGTKTWNSWGAGSPCTVEPPTDAWLHSDTQYTCAFQCDR